MLRFFLLICISACAACASLGPSDPETAELHLRVGTALLQNGSYPQALAELLKAEAADPSNAVVQNNLALTYFARERFEQAEQHLQKALKLKPNYTDAKTNLGRLYVEMKKYSEAEALLRDAAQDLTYTSPEKVYLNLGLSSFRQKKFADARKSLLKSIEFQRNGCLNQTLYGRTLFEQKDFSGAAATLDRAVGYCNGGPADEPQYYAGLAYYELGNQRKAETRLEEILKIYPNGSYYERARSMLETMRK